MSVCVFLSENQCCLASDMKCCGRAKVYWKYCCYNFVPPMLFCSCCSVNYLLGIKNCQPTHAISPPVATGNESALLFSRFVFPGNPSERTAYMFKHLWLIKPRSHVTADPHTCSAGKHTEKESQNRISSPATNLSDFYSISGS